MNKAHMTAPAPKYLYEQAWQAGKNAVGGAVDGYPCGFAWVNIKPARGPFVNWLKQQKIGRPDDYYGGYTIRASECCGFNGQNMVVKEDGCRAFADVLRANGINAVMYSRLD